MMSAPTLAIELRRLWWAAILLLGVSAGAAGWTIWQLRDDAIRAAITDSGKIATILAGQMSRSLESIDGVLLELRPSGPTFNIENASDMRAKLGNKAFYESLTRYLARLPQIFNIAIVDQDGQMVVSTAAWPPPNVNVADRDYFQDARMRADGSLSTSVPINNRIDGTRTIVFARRLDDAHGNFLGVAFASVNSKYFEDIYASIQSINSLIFTLVRQDGIILYRLPDSGDFTGRRLSAESAWLRSLSSGADGFRIFAQADGNIRYVSARRVPDYPLFVNISVTEGTALAGWFRRSVAIGLESSALLLCSLYLLAAVTRQVRRLSESESSLLQKSQQLDAALNNMSQGLCMFDREQRLLVFNKKYTEMYGFTPTAGMSLRDLFAIRSAEGSLPQERAHIVNRLELVAKNQPYCAVDRMPDGRTIAITHQPMSNGGWVALHQDITAQKRAEAELAYMARYDALTGLPNRAVFLESVRQAVARNRQTGEEFSILMLDLDGFKAVNDSLGHATGDRLLKAVAQRLRAMMPDGDQVARLHGDEFAIFQPVTHGQKARIGALATRILQVFTEPFDLSGRKVIIGSSIGVTFAPADGADAEALIRNADLALYKAKSEGRNRYCRFEATMEAEARERRELEDDMHRGILRNEFELHYQTIVDVAKQACCGAEALLRWRHPERGLIAPGQFIGIAEESGMIVPLGEWILRTACAAAAKWPSDLKLAVNLSPSQFTQGDLLGILRSTLKETGLAPERLELEITETVLIEKTEENLALLHALKALGVSIVLDDFGIGYSSMRYLQEFPFDKIKIDKSFIQSMASHADSAAIVRAIAGLGRSLDIETTAEGVETAEQLRLLRSAGCQLAQGFLFSRPVPAAQLVFDPPDAFRKEAEAA
jgi:diguanylate cyclase (GGDEF)-like protein/PAS domain S-box-containing protein